MTLHMARVGNDRLLDGTCGLNQGVNGTGHRVDDGHVGPDDSDRGHDGHDINSDCLRCRNHRGSWPGRPNCHWHCHLLVQYK